MSLGGYRFRPRWWGFALAAAGCAAGIALGNWQTGRAAQRRAAAAEFEAAASARAIELPTQSFDPAPLQRQRVAVRGQFDPRLMVLLDNRLHRGRPGYYVAQALRQSGNGTYVVVLRGWVAAPARRDRIPAIATPSGPQRIEGVGLERLPQYLEPGADAPCAPGGTPCVWQNLSLGKFAAWAQVEVAPLIVEQLSPLADGLDRDWERAETGYRRNEMYALQWYSLAALAAALFVVLSFRRDRPADGPGTA